MNDDLDSTNASRRWWLRSTLARLAFGASTRDVHASSQSSRSPLVTAAIAKPDLDDPAQREFGDYELLELIGQGGMGLVYRARQRGLNRDVAIKLLSAGQWASEEFIAGFRSEAQNAALLQHPNIVVVHEMGEHGGLVFYAMQLVRGHTLSQRLDAAGAPPPREAAILLRTVAEAVDYAHRLGVLHLDLKPGNILINEAGEPLVADFGLARRLEHALDIEHVSGTPSYMAPEQAQVHGPALSPATDVWGLGAILYELLTGRPPFEGGDPEATLQLLLEGQVRKPSRLAVVPPDLEAICLKCLARDPAQRYSGARALADDLGRYLEGRAVSVRPLTAMQRIGRWSRREPRLATAAALLAVTLLTGIAATTVQWKRAEASVHTARQQLWQQRIDETANTIQEHDPLDALLAMIQNLSEQEAAGATDAAELSRVRIGALLAQAPVLVDMIATGDTIEAIALDPAGKWAATASVSGRVRAFDLATGAKRWEIDTQAATRGWPHGVLVSLDVSADGKSLIASGHGRPEAPSRYAVYQLLLDATTGAMRTPPSGRFSRLVSATFSPDGRHAIVRTGDQPPSDRITSTLVRTADWQAIGASTSSALALSLLAPRAGSVARTFENDSLVEILAPADFAVRHRYHRSEARLLAWRYSNSGHHLALGYGDGQIALLDVDSGEATLLGPQLDGQVRFLSFSEDDVWLAASSNDGSILVWDLATGGPVADTLQLSGKLTFFMTQAAGSEAPRLSLDRRQRALLTVNSSRATLWRLPDTPGPATAQLQRPAYPRQMQKNATAMLPRQGLMVVGAGDGSLRLWRFHDRHPLPGVTPSIESGRAVTVTHDTATVRDTVTGIVIGPAIQYPQGIGYTTLTPDGGTLLATAGPRLYAHDPRSGRQRFAPIALDANPNGFLVSPRGDQLVVGHNAHDGGNNVEVLESYALATGERTGRVALRHPERLLKFSGDGAALLAWHVQIVDVLDARTLRPLFPALWPDEPAGVPGEIKTEGSFLSHLWVDDVASGDDGRSAWLLSAGKQSVLQPMDAVHGRIGKGWQLPSVGENLQWLPGARVAVTLPEADQVKLFERNGRHRTLLVHGLNGYAGLALSGDGTRLAVAVDQGAQLFDARSGDWLSPPMRVAPASDQIYAVAIDPRGQRLLLSSRGQRTWSIDLEAEQRPVAELTKLATLLRPDDMASTHAYAPVLDAPTRAALRARDPGPPRPQSVPVTATRTIRSGDPIATRVRRGMHTVDLRPSCNLGLATSHQTIFLELRLDQAFAPGRQRLLGIDYDVRCAIVASTLGGPQTQTSPMPERVAGIPVGPSRITTLHLLMTSGTQSRDRKAVPVAMVEFSYRDGSRTRLPILYRKQLWEWWTDSNEGGSRLAFLAFGSINSSSSTYPPSFFEVRLQNPHPERDVASLALEAVGQDWSQPVLLAITVESAASPRASNSQRRRGQNSGDAAIRTGPIPVAPSAGG